MTSFDGKSYVNGDSSSNNDDQEKFVDQVKDLNETIRRSVDNNPNENVLTRLATLSKTLSSKTANEMELFQLDHEDFDLEKILKYLVNYNQQQDVGLSAVDVVYEDVNIIGNNTAASVLKDVSDVFFMPLSMMYQKYINRNNKGPFLKDLPKTRKIIRNVNGFAKPGTLTLVLGRPGAGCSTYLKAISGQTQTYKESNGSITFNGIELKQMLKNLLIYNPELDVHFPFLTVEQTLKFALACKTPSVRHDNASREEYIDNIKDLYEILYGLKFVEKTLVGNDFIRGVSGGQRKRVSLAESMAMSGSVYCYDNATRGLDASTALEFVQALRTTTNVYKTSSLVTIYQASENIYELFDYVTVLYLGRQIYFGPIDQAVSYFERMGFVKHDRETTPEFLSSITDPMARNINPDFPNKASIPETADDFEKRWISSAEFQWVKDQISEIKQSKNDPQIELNQLADNAEKIKQKYVSRNSIYTVNYLTQLKACCTRRVEILLNNRAYAATLVIAAIIQSLVTGSLLYNITPETIGAFSKGGVLFFSCLYFALMTLAETPGLYMDKEILDKQQGYKMYHPSAELLSKHLVQFPVGLIAITLFCIIIYFLSGLKMDAGVFFQYYLFVILVVQAISALFMLFACIMPNASAAMGISGITMMSMVIYSSYMIQRPSMYWWFKWFSYCNPFLYAFESLILMQFHGLRMPCSTSELIPNGASYEGIDSKLNQVCGFVGAAASKVLYDGANDVNGDIYLELAFDYRFKDVWRNLGILFAFIIGYIFISCVIVENFNPIASSADQLFFIKKAKISKSMFEHFKAITAEADDSTDLEKNENEEVKVEVDTLVSSSSGEASEEHELGSKDIFTWQHINYEVPYEGEMRRLLDDVQGYVLPGTLTALMGESGAGKTTLLNVLSRRTDVGVVTGDMLINGQPMGSSFERRTGYVQQQDLHIAELTVRESLIFSARLRRPASVPDNEKIEYVDMIIKILHMQDYADSIAGVPGYGLNVEQRKKLSIATELVAKPSLLLFLDEPTSGLDSQSSYAIVKVLQELARAGQAILCTIHQPSATLFEKFDRLLLLKKGGQTVYFGDIGKDSYTVINYFERNGARKCSPTENPAEYILDVIGAGATATVSEDWFEIWQQSDECRVTSTTVGQLLEKGAEIAKSKVDNQDEDEELETKYATSYLYQLKLVMIRTFYEFWRSLPYIMPKFMLTLLTGLLIGFSFWDVKHTIIGNQNVMFASFLTIIVSSPLMNQIQVKAIASRELYEVRESKSNTFHWSCLTISQYLNEIPYGIVFSTVFFICWYLPIQLDRDAEHAGFWWFTYCFFFQLYYPSFALMILYPSPDLPTANILLGLAFSFTIGFCGVIQRPDLMPGFWKFMWRLSPLTYFVSNLLGISLHDRPIVCGTDEYNYLQPPSGQTCGEYLKDYFNENTGYVNNSDSISDCAVCQYSVGDDYLKSVGISYDDRWRNIGLYCAYIAFNFFLMNYLYYLFRVKKMSPTRLVQGLTGKFKKN